MRYHIKLAIAVSLFSAAQSVQAGPLRWGGYLVNRQLAETPEAPSSELTSETTFAEAPNGNVTTASPTSSVPSTTFIETSASAADHETGPRPSDRPDDRAEGGGAAGKPIFETLTDGPPMDESLQSLIDENSSRSTESTPDPYFTAIEPISSTETTPSESTPSDSVTITSAITPSKLPVQKPSTSESTLEQSTSSDQVTSPERQPTGFPESTPPNIDDDITKPITQTQFLPPTPTDEEPAPETPTSTPPSETSESSSDSTPTSSTPTSAESEVNPPSRSDEKGTPTTTLTPIPTETTATSESLFRSTTTEQTSIVSPPTTPEIPDEGHNGSPIDTSEPETSTKDIATKSSLSETPVFSSTPLPDGEVPIETPTQISSPSETPDVSSPSSSSTTTISTTTIVESEIETPTDLAPTSAPTSTQGEVPEVPEIPGGGQSSLPSSDTLGSTTVEVTISSDRGIPTTENLQQPPTTTEPQPSEEPQGPSEPAQPTTTEEPARDPQPPVETQESSEPVQPTTSEGITTRTEFVTTTTTGPTPTSYITTTVPPSNPQPPQQSNEPAPPATTEDSTTEAESEVETTVKATTTSTYFTTTTVSFPSGANTQVPTGGAPPTASTSLTPPQVAGNLQLAQELNAVFKTLNPSTPCSAGQTACINGKKATCKGGTFDITSCEVEGERCFAMPAEGVEGALVHCFDEKRAMAVLSGFGDEWSKTAALPKETKSEEAGGDQKPETTLTQSIGESEPTQQPPQGTEPSAGDPSQGAPLLTTTAPDAPSSTAEVKHTETWLSSDEPIFISIHPIVGAPDTIAEQAVPTGNASTTTQTIDGLPTVSVVTTATTTVTVTEPGPTVTVTERGDGAGDRVSQAIVTDVAESGDDNVVNQVV